MGALSCTPTEKYQEPFRPLLPGVCVAPYNDVAALERALSSDFAGAIVEVIQGEGGLVSMAPEFAQALNQACRKTGAILIADEVQTGMARTGAFYASEDVGLEPDIITLAKPLAGGLPLSAALIPEKIDVLIHQGDHGTTFGGGPVTTAVACKVWETVSDPGFIAKVRERGECLRSELEGLKKRHACVGELRGRGLLQGFEYARGVGDPNDVKDLLGQLQARGLLALRSGTNVVRLAPPLVITEKEIRKGIGIIEKELQ
jgi:acetylornithine/N-succinyldiaminopimelate aminotransferase